MEVYIARQPILDRQKRAQGYELLFRSGEENRFEGIDGTLATSRVIHNFLLSMGVEEVTGHKTAYINFTRDLLLKGIPELLNPENTVIEILEDIAADEEVLDCCRKLSQKGYSLALDDFAFSENIEVLLPLVQMVKIDIKKTSFPVIKEYQKRLSHYPLKLLAEKVETEEEFKATMDMGFHYFQGFFFSKPQILKRREIKAEKWNKLKLLKAIQKPNLEISELEELISRDVVISYKLLKYINSASIGLKVEVSSIRHASILLGMINLTRWLSLILLGEMGVDKPKELFKISSIRAKFCELLALETGKNDLGPELFIAGMFSLLDAIMDHPLDAILKELSLKEDLVNALLKQTGELKPYLSLTIGYEKGIWPEIQKASDELGIELKRISDCYLKAIQWAEDFTASL